MSGRRPLNKRPLYKRLYLRLVLAVVLLAAVAAHWAFWYAPRERAAVPRPGDRPARLFASGAYEASLWVPYPHQNLGALGGSLAGAVEEPAALAAAAARLAGIAEPRFFSFGPFAAPPARELALAADLDGSRFEVAARVYPTIAVLARLAGKLAGNPWLAGGEVEEGGRRVRIAWEGSLWTVAAGAPPAEDAAPPAAASAPALAALRLGASVHAPVHGIPAGTYWLRHTASGFSLAAAGREAPALDLRLEGTESVAVAFQAAESEAARAEAEAAAATPPPNRHAGLHPDLIIERETAAAAAIPPSPPAREGDRAGLLLDSREAFVPRVAVFFEPGHKRWKLPAEGLLEIVGERFPEGEAGGWGIVAIDDPAYERAAALAPRLAPLRDGPLAMGLWFQPAGARPIVDQLADLIAKVPLLDRKEARRWQDMALLLKALERFGRVVVEVGHGEGEARVLLESGHSPPN